MIGNIVGGALSIQNYNSFESIQTVTISGSSTYYVTFDSIPSTFKHLQIRGIGRSTTSGDYAAYLRFNSDSGNNYARHALEGNGSSAVANSTINTDGAHAGRVTTSSANASMYGAAIIDIFDYTNTNKHKVLRVFSGIDTNGTVAGASGTDLIVASGLWRSTSAITKIEMFAGAANWAAGSTFVLYGIKDI